MDHLTDALLKARIDDLDMHIDGLHQEIKDLTLRRAELDAELIHREYAVD